MEFVGRQRELAAIGRLLDRADQHHGDLLVVIGPRGSGKTALTDAASAEGRHRGFRVVRTTAVPPDVPAGAERLLVVVDDLDPGEADAVSGLVGTGTAVVVTTAVPIGLGPELRLGPLRREQFDDLLPALDADARDAVFLGARGLPGIALDLAATLDPAADPVVDLALRLKSSAAFLDIDVALAGLLEAALERPVPDSIRARLLARLARELLGDPAEAARRRELADEAIALAVASGDDQLLAEVLDARLHAIWDPTGAEDRLTTAATIIDLARRSADLQLEQRGLFWRFAASMELGRVTEAEAALAAYGRAGAAAGDAEAAAVVVARQAMLAAVRGQFDEARRLADDFAVAAARVALPDTDRLVATLEAGIFIEQGVSEEVPGSAEDLLAFARRRPGHLYEATAAFALVLEGRTAEAGAELARSSPAPCERRGRGGSAPWSSWRGWPSPPTSAYAMAAIFDAMVPYRGRLAVSGGANSCLGPAARHLGLLALQLGRVDEAVDLLRAAAAMEEHGGLLPGLANTSALLSEAVRRRAGAAMRARPPTSGGGPIVPAERLGIVCWSIASLRPPRCGRCTVTTATGCCGPATSGPASANGRGVHYLRMLRPPARPGDRRPRSGGGRRRPRRAGFGGAAPRRRGAAAYQRRLAALDGELDATDRAGDADRRPERSQRERAALVDELRRSTGLGGRSRRGDGRERAGPGRRLRGRCEPPSPGSARRRRRPPPISRRRCAPAGSAATRRRLEDPRAGGCDVRVVPSPFTPLG